jgi:hypothetical protein
MKGLGLAGLLAGVAYFISRFELVVVPDGLKALHILAAAGAIAGYILGEIASKHVTGAAARAGLVLLSFLACIGSVVLYLFKGESGSANIADILLLVVLMPSIFFSFMFLLGIAGVTIAQWGKPE